MADNVAITAGSGTSVKTDQVGSDHYQVIKIADGTADSGTVVAVDVGAKSNALRVAPANDITDATYIGDIKFGEALPAGTNEIGKLAAGTAAIGKLAANSGVDIGDVTLTAGTSAIGKLAANTGVDIGDVDITSIVPLTGATNLGKARDVALGANDVGVMALAVRDDTLTTLTPADGDFAPLRVSSTGALHVTGGGGGTEYTEDVATANPQVGSAIMVERDDALTAVTPIEADWIGLRGTAEGALWTQDFNSDAILADTTAILADTANMDTNIGTIAGDTTSIDGKITACNTGAVVVSSGTITANLGATDNAVLDAIAASLVTIDSDTNDIKTATEIIDDWDAVHDSAASSDGPQLMAAYDATKPTAVADGDAVRVLSDQYGRLLSGVEKTAWQEDYDSADASGEGEAIKASAASTILVVQSYVISVDAEMWVKLQEEDSTALTGKFWLKAGGGVAITLPDKAPLVLGTDSDLEVITEGAGNISVSVTGYTIPG